MNSKRTYVFAPLLWNYFKLGIFSSKDDTSWRLRSNNVFQMRQLEGLSLKKSVVMLTRSVHLWIVLATQDVALNILIFIVDPSR